MVWTVGLMDGVDGGVDGWCGRWGLVGGGG